jgi:hypothetical protein
MQNNTFSVDGKELRLFPLNENYGVTIDGDLYSRNRNIWMKKALTKFGYHQVNVKIPSKTSGVCYLHRIVLMTWGSMPPEGKNEVNHIDGNKLNNHVSNLQWNSRSENMLHGYKNGLCNAQRNAISERNKKDWAEGKKRNAVEMGGLKRKEFTRGIHKGAKKVINTDTGQIFDCIIDAYEHAKCSRSFMDKVLKGQNKEGFNYKFYV